VLHWGARNGPADRRGYALDGLVLPWAHIDSKAAARCGALQGRQKHRTLSEKQFFSAKKRPMFFLVFFALFARVMCGAGKGVFGEFLCLQRKFRQYFRNFHHFFSRFRKY
jgi:hypothetical protein